MLPAPPTYPAQDILPVILRAIRKQGGKRPLKARLWFGGYLTSVPETPDA